MDSLTLSTPLAHHSLPVLRLPFNLQPSRLTALFRPSSKPVNQPLKCSLTSFHHQTLTSSPSPESLLFHITSSSPQTPATAMRGAEADAMGLLLKERIVFLGNNIDDFVADAIISQLLLLDAQDPTKDIRLFINSPGGSLSATMAIFDVVRLVRADVSTVALGIAASTASIILGGGTKGKRFAMPNTRIMIHQPLGGASGQAIDVEIQAREVMHNKNNVTRIISDFTVGHLNKLRKILIEIVTCPLLKQLSITDMFPDEEYTSSNHRRSDKLDYVRKASNFLPFSFAVIEGASIFELWPEHHHKIRMKYHSQDFKILSFSPLEESNRDEETGGRTTYDL
ncbi:ATP-dependent Clp protease proteolytic subunit, chloroplastic [Sesamum angolense]|uniref:ATP-dependent Clp protease proteolytic subunit n=1 Tax=Sesamum angolense TaxID=2727404 RepID=A0AAE1WXA5_9LAMI|nr:ATP-dependent Clp protease proteolytic subunit, chloroplastic [Sesamum angolense]